MKKLVLTIILSYVLLFCFAQNEQPVIKKFASKTNEFVPAKWKVIAEVKGDLNKDGLTDVAMVIEDTNLKNLISNKGGMGGDTLNVNPRILLVLFKKANGLYELVTKNSSFIPSQNSTESPCLSDPFGENGGVTIENSLLKVHFQNFYSCGAWEIYNFDYNFRFQNQKFELIGYDKSSMHRSSGEETAMSMNFSTLRMKYTSGSNAFKDGGKIKTEWKNIKPRKLLTLNSITEESIMLFDY